MEIAALFLMATIRGLYNRIAKVDTEQIIAEAFEDSAGGYIENQQDQLYEGINSDGEQREPPYAPLTIQIKERKGQRTDVVTLNDTGSFYQGIVMEVRTDMLVTDSADEKTGDLIKKYGEEIFGLSPAYRKMYITDHLRPVFNKKVEAATGLTMKKS